LRSERARATLFAGPDVVEGAIPIHAPPIVERLTAIALIEAKPVFQATE